MNSLSSIAILSILSSAVISTDEVMIKVHNYTVRSQLVDGGCTENIDIYLTTYCGNKYHNSDTKSDDSCSATLNNVYTYTADQCDTSDSFYFEWTANNDCDGNFAAWYYGTCANDYVYGQTGSLEIDSFEECGVWDGPYIKSSIGGYDTVTYSLYKPCDEPTLSPTPSPTSSAASMYFILCINSEYSISSTDDADKIQIRLWTDDSEYQPTEWRYISPNDSTIFSDTSSATCHSFHTFNDIYAQWYLMDLSMCSTDGILIDRIIFWDMETESYFNIFEFNGDSDCIKLNGDAILLDADSTESSSKHAETSTNCQRLSINLSYYSIHYGDAGDTTDQSESTSAVYGDESDGCTSF